MSHHKSIVEGVALDLDAIERRQNRMSQGVAENIADDKIIVVEGPDRTWECAKGHTYVYPRPYTMAATPPIPNNGNWDEYTTGPICPICYVQSIGEAFPMTEKEVQHKEEATGQE